MSTEGAAADADARGAGPGAMQPIGPRWLPLPARQVPLGGVRGMTVLRTLPSRTLPTIGAWCFLDRFGPGPVRMRVDPHPHTGLQTVTWPLVGEVHHRDSVGSDVVLRRGQLNLMTAGTGIAHSEYSLGAEPVPLDALQLWVALPEASRRTAPGFEQHTALPGVTLAASVGEDATATVVLGDFAGVRSPASAHTPIVGAEIVLPAGTRVCLPLTPAWEHALMLVEGDAVVGARSLERSGLLYLGDSRSRLEVSTEAGALLFLLGGEPYADDLVLWWNFAAGSHDDIAQARQDWETPSAAAARFGRVIAHATERIPAPEMPRVRLKPRVSRP